MAVFISYSHDDRDFANKLAANLVMRKVRVWVDKWELSVGDSIVTRIQDAIKSADALIVILSRSSVDSEWCAKELSAGLIRELDEKRVVVLPLLLESCEIPLFLREKVYADFRSDFDDGLRVTLEAIAKVTSESLGRIDRPDFHTDWSITWGPYGEFFRVVITLAEHGAECPFTIITEVTLVANGPATARHAQYVQAGLDWWGRKMILLQLGQFASMNDLHFVLEDEEAQTQTFEIVDDRTGFRYEGTVLSQRLGEDTGKDVFVDYGGQLQVICSSSGEATRDLTQAEIERLSPLLAKWKPKVT